MKSIGILYIATGPYIVFWEEFYKTFEEHFLTDMERFYYVFTDAEHFYHDTDSHVKKIYQKAEPWPIPTLLKYHRFLEIEDQLMQYDYLYQSNGPIVCNANVCSDDFLPREELGEKLMFTLHPGYVNKPKRVYPYERRRKSRAYVPYNKGKTYVFGAMNGGKADAYISFMKELDKQITDDLNHGLIAKYHDESYVNHYVELHSEYRLLPCAYGYPDGIDIPGENIIACVNKEKYFDVNAFKGLRTDVDKREKKKVILYKHVWSRLYKLVDILLRRKVHE